MRPAPGQIYGETTANSRTADSTARIPVATGQCFDAATPRTQVRLVQRAAAARGRIEECRTAMRPCLLRIVAKTEARPCPGPSSGLPNGSSSRSERARASELNRRSVCPAAVAAGRPRCARARRGLTSIAARMVVLVSQTDHLLPVQERSRRTTDPIALNLFQQLRRMPPLDGRFVLTALDGRIADAAGERVVLARTAVQMFCRETGKQPSKKRYERWRLAHADAGTLPSATFIANTWQASWSLAMHELGYQPAPDHSVRRMARLGSVRSNEEMLDDVRECAADLGRSPRAYEYELWQRAKLASGVGAVRYVGKQTYRNRFGGWPEVLVAAGLPAAGPHSARALQVDWASGQPLHALREAAAEFDGQRLRSVQYEAWRARRIADDPEAANTIPTRPSISRYYGGWYLALAAAGLISDAAAGHIKGGAGYRFTDEELGRAVARFAVEFTGLPTRHAYVIWRREAMVREPDTHLPSEATVGQWAGSWRSVGERVDAHRSAGTTAPP